MRLTTIFMDRLKMNNRIIANKHKCLNLFLTSLIISLWILPVNIAYSKPSRAMNSFKNSSHRIYETRKISNFLPGVIAGALLFPPENNSFYDFNNLPYEEEMQEYFLNKQILNTETLSNEEKTKIELRNTQIINDRTKSAEKKYISSFSIRLIPTRETIIEEKFRKNTLNQKINDFLDPPDNREEPLQAKRKHILYNIDFFPGSAKSINEFDVVSINGMKPNISDPYFFSYAEKWGENLIKVKLRDKTNPNSILTLTTSYNVKEIQDFENFSNTAYIKFMMILSLVVLYKYLLRL